MSTETNGNDETSIERHIEARSQFSALVLKDTEYFTKVFPISGNTSFEEITCIGLEPQQKALHATIAIKRDSGYGGALCHGPGGREYVRFFADWNGDGDFTDASEDLGVASVAVHDIPGPKPLSYVVSLSLTHRQALCLLAKPVAVRAVLMYNSIPPAGNPNPFIVWGNRRDVHVQPQTRQWFLGDLLDQAKVKLSPSIAKLVDTEAVVSAPKPLPPVELVAEYATHKDAAPLHRVLAPQLATLAAALEGDASVAHPKALSAKFEALVGSELAKEIDLAKVIGAYLDLDGNTTYEQLRCVGLNEDLSAAVAVLDVKKSSGYSGGLCTSGSLEYVSFWADWDANGSFEEYLGTAQVRVHDQTMPAGGVQYAVFLPVNLAPHRRPCGESHLARIRAVLSWNTPPSSTNPYAVPVWGNHVESRVQLPVGEPVTGQVPFISVVGGMAVADIDAAGFATGTAVMAGFHASDSPFARQVAIAGHISNPPDLSAGQAQLTYGLRYRRDGEAASHEITNGFQVTVSRYSGGTWTQTQPTQTVDPTTHRYAYLEDLSPNGPSGDLAFVEGFVLGKWQTLGLADGRYEVWMEAEIGASLVESNHVWVHIDNTSPHVELILDGDPFAVQGEPVTGTLTATDDHFGSWSLGVLPGFPVSPVPSGGSAPAATGTAFSLATGAATPGGYVLQLGAVDRSIVNSGSVGLWSFTSVGFCIEEP